MTPQISCIEGHTVEIVDRGGSPRLHLLPEIASVKYSRIRSEKASAEIVVPAFACEKSRDQIAEIRSRRHEVVIWRGSDRVFEGPIVDLQWRANGLTIRANDVFEYLDGDVLASDWPHPPGQDSANMLNRVISILYTELQIPYKVQVDTGSGTGSTSITVPRWEKIKPPINLLPYLDVKKGDVITRSSTEAFEMTIGDSFEHVRAG